MRCFVAVTLPEPVIRSLVEVQRKVDCGRPVVAENLHLTLAFLDEQDEASLEDLHFELQRLRFAPFELSVAGVGHFGKTRPRLFFAGFDGSQPLRDLRRDVRRAARAAGMSLPHERFHPHVTLVRFSGSEPAIDAIHRATPSLAGLRLPPFGVTDFTLFRSVLMPDGPTYTPLCTYPIHTPQT